MSTVLAEYFVTDRYAVLFALTAEMDEPAVFPVEAPVEPVRDFALRHLGGADAGPLLGIGEADLEALLGPFVAPLERVAGAGDVVWFVPHEALHGLPLHAVPLAGAPLIERNPVCYTPSAGVMRYCQERRTGSRERALVVGDSRRDLLHARDEARMVADLFGADPVFGDAATKRFLIESIAHEGDQLDVIHLSCHGWFDQDDPLRSGIALAQPNESEDGLLTAAELLELELHADLVTLSACESGVSERRAGDELMGLMRAVLNGTPSALVSLWEVDDLSTSLAMRRFYERLLAGATKAEALRDAQLHVRGMTASDVVEHCAARIAELDGTDPDSARVLRLAQADGRAAAGDLDAALRAYEAEDTESAGALATRIEEARDLLRFKLRAAGPVDYGRRPFASVYHWAPMVLFGDWR